MVLERVLPLARCPACLGVLVLSEESRTPAGDGGNGDQIQSGILACPACRTQYRIVDGIPLLCSA